MTSRRSIPIVFPQRRSALAAFRTEGARLSLFVPTTVPAAIEEPVTLSVTFGDCPNWFELTGKVRWRRDSARGMSQGAGLGVEFEGTEKLPLAAMVAFCAGRPLEAGTAGKSRYQVRIPCRIRALDRTVEGEITDLSESGVYVAAKIRVKPGLDLKLQLDPKWLGLGGDWVEMKVVWVGDKVGKAGFGARFSGATASFLPAIKKYLPG